MIAGIFYECLVEGSRRRTCGTYDKQLIISNRSQQHKGSVQKEALHVISELAAGS
jgi:hypothetical protein